MSQSRVVLITGANSGIGYATAKVMVTSSNHYHVIVASRTLAKAQDAVHRLQAENSGIRSGLSAIQLEVTDQASVDAAASQVEKAHGRLDVLINNAGVTSKEDPLVARLQIDFDVNVVGAARVTEAFKPLLARSDSAYLIYVASVVGWTKIFEQMDNVVKWKSYCTSKAAMLMLALSEYHEAKILGSKTKVFAMCPGFVVSNLRGTSEEERNPNGAAGDPEVSGRTLLAIVEGERDADVGKFLHKDGIYPW